MNFDQYQALCAAAIASLNTASIAVTAVKGDSFTLNGVTLDLLFDDVLTRAMCQKPMPHRTTRLHQMMTSSVQAAH